ncbi:23S rRNA (guanosine(2251)-2'-O)-methyltransferase RlmB [Pseudemcibacter aquimaris]|uniref:23S rRNA (guanosine(2251)-2'-O)-methyltransferase RlmB n=1 Tax=Pseudemcibacter aquimaris TaxID=2857064 RepID=UPI002012696C|nr:23S rRNA (guanosine(2251)-2'-O)-methyltransferase RlmB [Pseudemcibacter aquimaris]MCC3862331.1 23S rRNA (guanosine(2251)-2'-O)-methyltransferase RlmB [Pseudemcibacter aquimaris]WDU59238.1 23S rRNA (guanosine(2251)-2'-O)-methyltransferase RlmB [Pseudemcibacter aquimaris]
MSRKKNKLSSPKNKNRAPKKNNSPRGQTHHQSRGQNFDASKSPKVTNNGLWLYGKHAVLSALENPLRRIKRLIVSKRSHDQYQADLKKIHLEHRALNPEIAPIEVFEKNLPADSVHQGIALLTDPLPDTHLDEACVALPDQRNLVLILDQVTDPHNVGAIIRSAAAFGAKAIVTTDRHAPPESGVLAKSASGALEALPWVRVTNLSRALDTLAEMGYWRIGLDGYADQDVRDADFGDNIALVLGAEGKGIRKGTADHCDGLVKLPISRTVESLNVSNAAAVALYVFSA